MKKELQNAYASHVSANLVFLSNSISEINCKNIVEKAACMLHFCLTLGYHELISRIMGVAYEWSALFLREK